MQIRATFPRYQEYYTVIIQLKGQKDAAQTTVGKFYVGKYFTSKGEFDEPGFHADLKKHLERFDQKKFGEFQYTHSKQD